MEQITFNGEHLWIGNLGHFLVVLSFVSSIVGAFFYWRSANGKDTDHNRKAGDISFIVQVLAVAGIIITLFAIIYNHYFEYFYAWQHSSLSLPTHYMISCFWEGQEGSFLLWMFWQSILGLILIFNKSAWKAPVMSVLLLSQAVLSSMLLGIEITDSYKFGSSPFALLRDIKPEILALPVMAMRGIAKADYLQLITDGTGLNPLLQNYWMVIHPPTLFFGFASTITPFAFAIAGLWKRQYTEWIRPALPWTLLAVLVLGAGIIMGGVWAYESLSFGGYWAWDPVENASLVPWLILIAGLHVMLLNRASGQSIILTYLLILGSFLLVLYATFLTRSGVLGDTSVHSFTDLGLSRQLLVYLFLFCLLPVFASYNSDRSRWIFPVLFVLLLLVNILAGEFLFVPNVLYLIAALVIMIRNFRLNLPLSKKEESVYSREFWMFIGALVLILSAVQVISTTSIPVMNKVFGQLSGFWNWLYHATGMGMFQTLSEGKLAPPNDPLMHYNKWQLPIAIIMALLTAFAQFTRYRDQKGKKGFWMETGISAGLSVVLTVITVWIGGYTQLLFILLLFAAYFTMAGNVLFVVSGLKGRFALAGGSIAHIGFGLMLVGVLVSGVGKNVISINTLYNYGTNFSDKETRENILLYKNEPVQMAEYMVTYKGDSVEGPNNYYIVDYEHTATGERFTLFPNAQMSREMGLVANPDTRHYLSRDIFTHVSSVPNKLEPQEEWISEEMHEMEVGDTIVVNRHLVILREVRKLDGTEIAHDLEGHMLQVAELDVIGMDSVVRVRPLFGVKDGLNSYNVFSYAERARIRFNYFPEEVEGVTVHRIETAIKPKDYIIMKAIVFPYINVLWSGMLIMLAGFGVALRQRLVSGRK